MGFDQGKVLVGVLRFSFCQSLVDRCVSRLFGAIFPASRVQIGSVFDVRSI